MREIKFRGKVNDIINHRWVYGSLMRDSIKKLAWIYQQEGDSLCMYCVHWETVGQYTGLKDKNKVEIYAADKVIWDGSEYEITWSGEFGWILKDDRHDWECPNLYAISSPKQSRIEIIGNQFENSELVKA